MCLNPIEVKTYPYPVPCGKCLECKVNHSNEWAFRIMGEASCYEHNCMITLTYNEECKPLDGSVSVRSMQLFLKRLRKRLKQHKIRYFLCGEYGKKFLRPHYHIIIFGFVPDDLVFLKKDKYGFPLYTSSFIQDVWPFGFNTVAELTLKSAKYCAKYLQKQPPDVLHKPFLLMSRRPAIGVPSIIGLNLRTDKIYADGKYRNLPRAYLNYLEKHIDISELKARRLIHAFGNFLDKTNPNISKFSFIMNLNTYGKTYGIGRFDRKTYQKYVLNRRRKFELIFSKFVL